MVFLTLFHLQHFILFTFIERLNNFHLLDLYDALVLFGISYMIVSSFKNIKLAKRYKQVNSLIFFSVTFQRLCFDPTMMSLANFYIATGTNMIKMLSWRPPPTDASKRSILGIYNCYTLTLCHKI